MGRNPFLTYSKEYLKEYRAYLEESTIQEQRKKLKYIGTVFNHLKWDEVVDTANPKKMKEKEIREFMIWMKEKNLNPNTQAKYLQILGNVLRYCGNSTLDLMRSKRLLPKGHQNEIRSLSESEINEIYNASTKIDGWNGEVATFICSVYPFTGLRPSELRLAARVDLDEHKWTLWVRNPKGKNRYGRQRTVPIPSPIRLRVMDFLQVRKEHLETHGIGECEPLIPRITDKGEIFYYSSKHFRMLKQQVAKIAGIEFKIKDFRASFAQILKDKGVSIESISKALGHSTTRTTELFYARIRDVSMMDDINKVWLSEPDAKKSRISVLAR